MITLENGLRVVHTEHQGPMASIYLWFDVGTIDEQPGEHGAAHLLEHMLFKGTDSHGVGEVAAAIEALGGDLNAYTVWDQTVLHASVLAPHWREALNVLAEMAWRSTLDPEEFEREKLVVIEEIRGYDNEPQSVVDDALTAALFPKHGYGRPVLGTEESVRGIGRDCLHDFWRRHYGANRCVLGGVGPFTKTELVEAAASMAPTTAAERQPIPPLVPCTAGTAAVPGDFDTPIIVLGFRTVGGMHTDVPALEVLAQALGSGRASILQRELRFGTHLVNEIWATSYARRKGGSFEIGFVPAAGKNKEALRAVLQRLQDLREGVQTSDVRRGRNNLISDRVFASESVDPIAHDLVWFTSRANQPEGRAAWNRELAIVDTEQVSRLARATFVDPVIRVLSAEAFTTTLPKPPPPPALKSLRISGRDDDWPTQGAVFSVYVGMPGGRLAEHPKRAGTADAWASLVTAGAGPFDSVQFAAELDRIAGSIRAIAGHNTSGLQLTVPATEARRGLELLRLVLESPRFDTSEWKRLHEEYAFDLATIGDRPGEVLGRRVAKLAFPNHPWGRVLTRSSLRAIGPQTLRRFHEESLSRGVRVGVAGRCPLSLLEPLELGDHPLQPTVPPLSPLRTGRFESRAGHEQALVVLARRAPAVAHADNPALAVAIGVLGAQAGRLFMALRERRSLAYSVWAQRRTGWSSGLINIGLATDPARLPEARKELARAWDELVANGPTPEERQRTITMLIGQFASSHQNASTRATHLALAQLYGHTAGLESYRARLEAVRCVDVRDALQRLPEGFSLTVRP